MQAQQRVENSSQHTIAIAPPAALAALGPLVAAAGWARGEGAPLAWLVDARDGMATVMEIAPAARDDQAALVAIVATEAAFDAAYAAGATHAVVGDDPRALARMLRFAGRHARRVRRLAPARRGGELSPGTVARFVTARAGGQTPLAVLAIALSRFDIVNAAFGRSTGDALLADAFERIETALAPVAAADRAIARSDGAGFEVVLAAPGAVVSGIVTAIEAALARPFDAGDAVINLGARIGVARRAAGEAAVELPARARDALAAAQAADGAAVRQAQRPREAPLATLAADLYHAIDRDEIAMLFQPQVSLASGAITGVEALARWEHPSLGVLGAETLFAAADRADLGSALSDHILGRALAATAAWPAALAHLRMAVNVTAADVARPDFAERFLSRLAASGVARERVTAEITETGLIGELEPAARALGALRDAGVRVALDDFGTGYSSLAYLKTLPLDYLKIDRSLTRDIVGAPRDRVIVRGVIAMANALGLATIAEGVERDEERDLIAAEGCDFYQGYLCAGPVDSAALAALVIESAPAKAQPTLPFA